MPVPRILQGRQGPLRLTADPPRRGGQAEVYRGLDARGRIVAVKVSLEGEDERRGLLAERAALQAIQGRQPGSARWLVPLLDEGALPDGRPFLVLPWYDHSLQSWLLLGPPPLGRRVEALIRAAEAVVQLHRSAASLAGVVLHRDLKPGNLLVEEGPDGLRVVLADLGGVKERGLHDATRNTGIHTPWYAPLEQMLPLERPPDPSVDVHALAVLVYAVLVGRAPQAAMARMGLLTHAADELWSLHEKGGGRSAVENARYVELRRAPLEILVELDHAVALPEEDVNRLRQGLVGLLAEQGSQAEEIAAELTAVLVPTLRHAMEVDPRRRLSRPEVLLAALEAVRGRVPEPVRGEEVSTLGLERPPPVEEEKSTWKGEKPRRSWMGVAALLGALALLGMCTGLGEVARMLMKSDAPAADPSPPPVAVAAPTVPAPPVVAKSTAEVPAAALPVPAPVVSVPAPLSGRPKDPDPVALAPPTVDPPPAVVKAAAPEPAPPTVKILVEDDATALIAVDGGSPHPGSLKLEGLRTGVHRVEIQSSRAAEPRTFALTLALQDPTHWSLSVQDPLGKAGGPVEIAPAATARVRWTKEGAITLEN